MLEELIVNDADLDRFHLSIVRFQLRDDLRFRLQYAKLVFLLFISV